MENLDEQWRPVVGYEGIYSVSTLGRVRSEPRISVQANGSRRTVKGCVLKPYVMKKGYCLYDLRKDNVAVNRYGHRLVLEAFVGPCPNGTEGCHNNGVRNDNRLENLRWDTHKSNNADKLAHGTSRRNEAHPQVKLSDDDVRDIRCDQRRPTEIAAQYGIHWRSVYAIKQHKYRPHVI